MLLLLPGRLNRHAQWPLLLLPLLGARQLPFLQRQQHLLQLLQQPPQAAILRLQLAIGKLEEQQQWERARAHTCWLQLQRVLAAGCKRGHQPTPRGPHTSSCRTAFMASSFSRAALTAAALLRLLAASASASVARCWSASCACSSATLACASCSCWLRWASSAESWPCMWCVEWCVWWRVGLPSSRDSPLCSYRHAAAHLLALAAAEDGLNALQRQRRVLQQQAPQVGLGPRRPARLVLQLPLHAHLIPGQVDGRARGSSVRHAWCVQSALPPPHPPPPHTHTHCVAAVALLPLSQLLRRLCEALGVLHPPRLQVGHLGLGGLELVGQRVLLLQQLARRVLQLTRMLLRL